MKKRFLPFSLLLVIMILGQSVMADQVGHYVPRVKENVNTEAFMSSLRVNQHTGLIDPAWLVAASKDASNSVKDRSDVIYWKSMGPDNVGGKTTSVLFNKLHPSQVYIGTMGGGVFYTYNHGISWHKVGENLMVSCMAQADDGTIYVGTGDCGESYDYNGLGDMGYTNSFVGTGLYKIDANNVMTVVESTVPSTVNDVTEWSFINDVAADGGFVAVATPEGLKFTSDCLTWNYAKCGGANIDGNAVEVKVANHKFVASVDGKIYIGSLDNMVCKSADGSNDEVGENGKIVGIGTAAGLLDVAIAPQMVDGVLSSESTIIYASTIATTGNHVKIYVSEDEGLTWTIILPTVSNAFGHQVYDAMGLYNHGLMVNPNNPDILYVLGYNMWLLQKPAEQSSGYYMAQQISSSSSLHVGLNAMAFDPTDYKLAYVATEGGIYRGVSDGVFFSFYDCNRGNISARSIAVAPSGSLTRVLGGLTDQGPVVIAGIEGTNNLETAELLLPALVGAHYGTFSSSYTGGSCAASIIQPESFFLTTIDGGLYRTETGGEDYDFSNFSSHASYAVTSNYRTPILLVEDFDDELSKATVQLKNETGATLHTGDVVQLMSNNKYPFNHTLTANLHDNDSIDVLDPVTARLYLATTDAVYVVDDPLYFSSQTVWWKLTQSNTDGFTDEFSGTPLCLALADNENLFVGTIEGDVYRFMGDNSSTIDSIWYKYNASGSVTGTYYSHFVSVDVMTLPTNGQCVTSVAADPRDGNKVIVTLGNYGNDSYVLYSTNALSSNPTFTAVQGNLPKMPVYSSVIEMATGHVIIGTEHGIYRTTNISSSSPNWTLESDNMGDIPVMELKQQIVDQDDQYVSVSYDSVAVVTTYPGTNNLGVIYAATYGRGLFRCETYRQNSGSSVPETPALTAKSSLVMYPNPVRDEAKVSFELNNNAEVSLQVYDMSGRMVKTQALGSFTEGKHEVDVTVNDLAKGAYVLRLTSGSVTSSVKFMVF